MRLIAVFALLLAGLAAPATAQDAPAAPAPTEAVPPAAAPDAPATPATTQEAPPAPAATAETPAAPAATPAAPAAPAPSPVTRASAAVPATATEPRNIWLLDLSDGGRVTISLRPDVAPLMVDRVKTLTRQHFYDGLAFHRVIDGFMAQGGDPKGDGTGGSNLPDLKAEFNTLPHVRGSVAAARADSDNSANSQFYIVFQPKFSLDKKYTVFGRVMSGMQYVDAIERGEPPANPTKILHAYIASDNPPAYQAAPPPAPVSLTPAATLPASTPPKK